ncbi:hypothetical protein Tco_0240819 [Tanacetum coccineum]
MLLVVSHPKKTCSLDSTPELHDGHEIEMMSSSRDDRLKRFGGVMELGCGGGGGVRGRSVEVYRWRLLRVTLEQCFVLRGESMVIREVVGSDVAFSISVFAVSGVSSAGWDGDVVSERESQPVGPYKNCGVNAGIEYPGLGERSREGEVEEVVPEGDVGRRRRRREGGPLGMRGLNGTVERRKRGREEEELSLGGSTLRKRRGMGLRSPGNPIRHLLSRDTSRDPKERKTLNTWKDVLLFNLVDQV